MSVSVGSAPDAWGVWFPDDPKQIPWQRFLDEVAEAGYEWIELGPYGYLPTNLATLRSELEKRGLKVSATFALAKLEDKAAWPHLEKQVLGAGELLASIGAKFLVLIDDVYSDLDTGELVAPARLDTASWQRLIETTHKVADIAWDRFGLKLVFHPHADTHVEYEDQMEVFLKQTDPARIGLCLDTGHFAYRGGDPLSFMRRHHQRIPYLHFKTVDAEVLKEVQTKKISLGPAVQMGVFCELAHGSVDFPAFRDLLRDLGYEGWGIVEQDMHGAPWDKPLPVAKRARAYLREIGMG
jgi:inosose dehydratase